MSGKQIISIIILIAAVVGVVVFVWTTFLSDPAQVTTAPTPGSHILPHGGKLDFNVVKEFNPNSRLYQYPEVNASEVGNTLGQIIKQ